MVDLDERLTVLGPRIHQLIDDKRYFVFHAPRQTGKTTLMRALAQSMTQTGKYAALYVNVEAGQPFRDPEKLNECIVSCLIGAADDLPETLRPSESLYQVPSWTQGMSYMLKKWCMSIDRPLVLLLDEVDALIGDGLLSILRQLRAGYNDRPKKFPHSVCLIGVRDIRDYRIYSDEQQKFIIGGSAFNIKEAALVLGNFTHDQTRRLYQQHTYATGQPFEEEAVALVYEQTLGQPWLVNAIGRELCFGDNPIAGGQSVTTAHVKAAIERLILRCDVHIDQLGDKLTEPRVARIIEPILLGQNLPSGISLEDRSYLTDLGLVHDGPRGLEIANPIYKSVIPRFLTTIDESYLGQDPRDYKTPEGRLNMDLLLERLIDFYKQHHEMITKRGTYTEAAHHLVFLAWLHRIVNSGGSIVPEYAVGLGRMDLHIRYADQSFALELKLAGAGVLEKGLEQLNGYLQRLGLDSGYLVLFQRSVVDNIDQIGRREQHQVDHRRIEVIYL